MALSPELRQRILEEEQLRMEARARLYAEQRLRRHHSALLTRLVLMAALFAASYTVSQTYLVKARQAVEPLAPVGEPTLEVPQPVLDDVTGVLVARVDGVACAATAGRGQPQIRGTIELARDVSRDVARRLAMARARAVGATLRRHGLALPAYVEVVTPSRWHGVAVYDRDTLRVTWDPCPGRCEQEGSRYVRRCSLGEATAAGER